MGVIKNFASCKIFTGPQIEASFTEAVVRRFSVKNVFLEITQNSQENPCARVTFSTLFKKRLWHRRFPVSFSKFLSLQLY